MLRIALDEAMASDDVAALSTNQSMLGDESDTSFSMGHVAESSPSVALPTARHGSGLALGLTPVSPALDQSTHSSEMSFV
jgi:hypothetical protein